jgi:hypothetical protein
MPDDDTKHHKQIKALDHFAISTKKTPPIGPVYVSKPGEFPR